MPTESEFYKLDKEVVQLTCSLNSNWWNQAWVYNIHLLHVLSA